MYKKNEPLNADKCCTHFITPPQKSKIDCCSTLHKELLSLSNNNNTGGKKRKKEEVSNDFFIILTLTKIMYL